MNRIQIKERAKSAVNANLGICIIAYLVYSLVVSFLNGVGIGTIISPLVAVGIYAGFLKMLREDNVQFEDFINGITENIGTKFITTLLVTIYTMLWTLLFIIPGIIKGYSYAMTYYILLDRPELTATQSIDESRKMMDGHKMELFMLDLSFIGWYLLGILTCGLLLFWVAPYHLTARTTFYEELKGPDAPEEIENPEIVIPE